MSRIYLDKISTGPHVPNHPLFQAHNLTTVLPDMNHTGIVTKFGTFKPKTCGPDGRIPLTTRDMAFKKTRPIERERIHQESQEKVFVLNHTQFMNNVLSDLEKAKREKDQRRDDLLGTSIKDHNSLTVSGGMLSEYMPQSMVSTKSMHGKMVSAKDSMFSSVSALSAKKKRACNREELVTCLLDSVDPPRSTKEWFGTLPRENDATNPATSPNTAMMLSAPHFTAPESAPRSPPSRGITAAAQEKWEAESIFKAVHGCEAADKLRSGRGSPRHSSKSPITASSKLSTTSIISASSKQQSRKL